MSWRRAPLTGALWPAVGGGGMFTIWAWLAMAPICLTVLGGYDAATTGAERVTGVAIAAVVHLLTGVLIFFAATIEHRVPRPDTRASYVIVAAVVIGAVRPLLIDGLQYRLGTPLFDGFMSTRIATNVIFTVASLTLCGVVVHGARRYRAVQARLHRVEHALEEARRGDENDLNTLTRQFLQEAERVVVAALTAAHERPFDAEGQAKALRELSNDVVRPLSHRLFEPAAALDDDSPSDDDGAAESEPRLALRPSPTLPWLAPVLYLAGVLPALVSNWGPYAAISAGITGLAIGVVGDRVVERLSPRTQGFWLWLVVIALGYVGVGAVIGLSSAVLGALSGHDGPIFAVNLITYPIVATTAAIGSSVAWGLREAEVNLARALGEAQRVTAHTRVRLVSAREHAARILHSAVQGELIATAIKLQRGLAGSEEIDRSRDRILEVFHGAGGVPSRQPEAVRESILRVVTAWSSAIQLDFEADPAAWELLAADSVRGAVALDALSEALSNVVRHASQPTAHVRLYAGRDVEAAVRLEVRSPGALSAQRSNAREPTFGLTDLGRRTREVTLYEQDAEVVLTVTLA